MESQPAPSAPQPDPQAPASAGAPAPVATPLWMRLLGLRRRQGRISIVPTIWGWILVAAVVGMAGMAGFAEYSMKPDFCRSCHLMEPYYQAWHSSSHSKVACVDCHFEPGLSNTIRGKWQASSQAAKFITGTYGSKPHAEVHDVSCMRSGCHEKRLLEGKVKWTVTSPEGNQVTIRFDHTPHLKEQRRGKQLRCVSCHSQMVQGQHIAVTLETCFLCHFKGVEHGRNDKSIGGCSACHDAPEGQIKLATGIFEHGKYLERGVACQNCHSDSIKGDGSVTRQVCWACHNQPKQIARFGDTTFLHTEHISGHKVECSNCHTQIEHSLIAGAPKSHAGLVGANPLADAGSCGQCHEKLHMGPAELYRGVGGRNVPDMPSPMYRAQVDCIACHRTVKESEPTAEVVGQTFVAAQASCDYCHGAHYGDLLQAWKQTIDDQLQQAETVFHQATKALDKANLDAQQDLKARRALDDAGHNIRLVKLGHGVHNAIYSTAVLSASMESSRSVLAMTGQKVEPRAGAAGAAGGVSGGGGATGKRP